MKTRNRGEKEFGTGKGNRKKLGWGCIIATVFRLCSTQALRFSKECNEMCSDTCKETKASHGSGWGCE